MMVQFEPKSLLTTRIEKADLVDGRCYNKQSKNESAI